MILRMPRSWFPWGKRLELKKGMKEMNKRLWALLTALALLLPGCGGGGGENRPEIRVGLALYKEDDTFIEAITEGIHRAAAESSREGTGRLFPWLTPRAVRSPRTNRLSVFCPWDMMCCVSI